MTMVGQTLDGRYVLDALIGAGGMATVYRARDLRLDRDVAVKVLSPNLAHDPALGERFDREARFLAALSHPSIVAVHDVGESDGERYYVMELVDGVSMAERLGREGRLPAVDAVPILAAVADGLAALHERGFVHRDVKPHNILLAPSGAKLADFGLVRDAAASELTAPGTTVGTLAYLAPELLRGEPATPASDVYALGVVAYLTLTGRPPYPAETLAGLVAAHAARPSPPSEVAPELGPRFDAPLLAALGPAGGRPNARAFAAGLAATAPATPAASLADAATLVAPVPAAAAFPPLAPAGAGPAVAAASVPTAPLRRRGVRPGLPWWPVAAIVLLAAAAVGLALLANQDGRPATGLGDGTPTPEGASTATERSEATPAGAQTEAPTATAEAPAHPDRIGALLGALDAFDVAVDEAQGGRDGLRGDQANDLHRAADAVRDAIAGRNAEEARERVARLVERAREVVDEEGLADTDAGAGLLAAAEEVRVASDSAFGGGGGDGGGDDGEGDSGGDD